MVRDPVETESKSLEDWPIQFTKEMDFDNEMQYLEDMDKLIRQMDCDDSFYIEELELEMWHSKLKQIPC